MDLKIPPCDYLNWKWVGKRNQQWDFQSFQCYIIVCTVRTLAYYDVLLYAKDRRDLVDSPNFNEPLNVFGCLILLKWILTPFDFSESDLVLRPFQPCVGDSTFKSIIMSSRRTFFNAETLSSTVFLVLHINILRLFKLV